MILVARGSEVRVNFWALASRRPMEHLKKNQRASSYDEATSSTRLKHA
jgi:hypothetical protein